MGNETGCTGTGPDRDFKMESLSVKELLKFIQDVNDRDLKEIVRIRINIGFPMIVSNKIKETQNED